MSFSEMGYSHQILRVDLDGETVTEVAAIPVPRAVELLRVPARPAPVDEVLAALSALDLPDAPEQAWSYLEVRVQLDAPEPTLRTPKSPAKRQDRRPRAPGARPRPGTGRSRRALSSGADSSAS